MKKLSTLNKYSELVGNYSKNAVKWNLDITTSLEPPKDLFVEVKVMEEIGEIYLPESGSINLKKNTIHFIRKNEIEQFLKTGQLELIENI